MKLEKIMFSPEWIEMRNDDVCYSLSYVQQIECVPYAQ